MRKLAPRAVCLLCVALALVLRAAADEAADDQYAVASRHYAEQRWQLAVDEFRALLKQHPKHARAADALFFCGEALAQLEQPAEAAECFKRLLKEHPQSKRARQALFRSGEAALVAGDRQAAQRQLEAFQKQYPADALAAYATPYLAELQLAEGNLRRAAELYHDALTRFADGPLAGDCLLGLVQVALKESDLAAAAKQLDELERRFADSPLRAEAALAVADALVQQGRHDEAARRIEPLLARALPAEWKARSQAALAVCQARLKQWDAARRAYDELSRDPAQAELTLHTAQQLAEAASAAGNLAWSRSILQDLAGKEKDPGRAADVLVALAKNQLQAGDLRGAEESYGRLIKEHPASPHHDAALHGRAMLLKKLARASEARELWQQLRREHPQSRLWGEATYRLAELALDGKQYDEAQQLSADVLLASPAPALAQHVLYLQGRLAVARQKWEEVEPPLARLVHDDPDCPLAWSANYLIAESLYRRGEHAQAAERFARLDQPDLVADARWRGMCRLRRAQSLIQLQQWAEAQRLAESFQADFPRFAQAHEVDYVLGRALAGQGQFDKARQAYQVVVRSPRAGKSETAAMAQWMIGESYFHQENYDQALREYLRVEILYAWPRWQAAALLQAGKCQEQLEQWQPAAESYSKLVEQYPDSDLVEEAKRRLTAAREQAAGARSASTPPNRG